MSITTDFHAAKDISSDFVVSNDVDICGKLSGMDINLLRTFLPDNKLEKKEIIETGY